LSYSFSPEDGGSTFLRNVSEFVPGCRPAHICRVTAPWGARTPRGQGGTENIEDDPQFSLNSILLIRIPLEACMFVCVYSVST
jgi:hypothetical protein